MKPDELAARLRTTFLAELEEQIALMNAELIELERQPRAAERIKALFRIAHTVKGAARAAGVPLVEQTCHSLESLLAQVRDGKLELAQDHFASLFAAADALSDACQRLRAGKSLDDSPLATFHAAPTGARSPTRRPPPVPSQAMPTDVLTEDRPSPGGQVRVRPEKLDTLLASAGQLLVARRLDADWSAGLEEVHLAARRSADAWRRGGRDLRRALERAGTPGRAMQTLATLEENVRVIARESERLVAAGVRRTRSLNVATDDVLLRVRQVRMRPFADACEALPRVVRDVASGSGKEVRLLVDGGEVEADRAVLDGLREALLHLVRNAVDHGIEAPDDRARASKPRQGTVRVAAALRQDRVVVTVSDDGVGVDADAIRSRMARLGLPAPEDEVAVASALFHGGLSTRAEPTAVSGRGVGLDLVRAAIASVRGAVAAQWKKGQGTTITLECPPSLATVRALLAVVSSQFFAIPTAHVERLLRVAPSDIKRVEGRDVISVANGPVPLVSLARVLPPLTERPVSGPVPVILLRMADRRLAVVVDDLVAEEEILLQPLDRKRGPLPLLSGAALLGTGKVALVLDIAAVIAASLTPGAGGLTVAPPGTHAARRRLLVVDDSITTRTLEQSILEAADYDVVTAVDGADGWRLLQEAGADLVVADVEMPRMDGFALCEAIRSSKRFQKLPVVLVTALESPTHRARGLEVGADAYIGKSSFDQQSLLDTIRQLLD